MLVICPNMISLVINFLNAFTLQLGQGEEQQRVNWRSMATQRSTGILLLRMRIESSREEELEISTNLASNQKQEIGLRLPRSSVQVLARCRAPLDHNGRK
jgi:hypothetical protein